MTQAQVLKKAIKKYGKHVQVEKDLKKGCPYRVFKNDKFLGWGHTWIQALKGPCPHFKKLKKKLSKMVIPVLVYSTGRNN